MRYDNLTPANTSLVIIEWEDIATDSEGIGCIDRWTVGWLLDREYKKKYFVTAITWDDGGWSEFSTFPADNVKYVDIILRRGADG